MTDVNTLDKPKTTLHNDVHMIEKVQSFESMNSKTEWLEGKNEQAFNLETTQELSHDSKIKETIDMTPKKVNMKKIGRFNILETDIPPNMSSDSTITTMMTTNGHLSDSSTPSSPSPQSSSSSFKHREATETTQKNSLSNTNNAYDSSVQPVDNNTSDVEKLGSQEEVENRVTLPQVKKKGRFVLTSAESLKESSSKVVDNDSSHQQTSKSLTMDIKVETTSENASSCSVTSNVIGPCSSNSDQKQEFILLEEPQAKIPNGVTQPVTSLKGSLVALSQRVGFGKFAQMCEQMRLEATEAEDFIIKMQDEIKDLRQKNKEISQEKIEMEQNYLEEKTKRESLEVKAKRLKKELTQAQEDLNLCRLTRKIGPLTSSTKEGPLEPTPTFHQNGLYNAGFEQSGFTLKPSEDISGAHILEEKTIDFLKQQLHERPSNRNGSYCTLPLAHDNTGKSSLSMNTLSSNFRIRSVSHGDMKHSMNGCLQFSSGESRRNVGTSNAKGVSSKPIIPLENFDPLCQGKMRDSKDDLSSMINGISKSLSLEKLDCESKVAEGEGSVEHELS